jgi:hypothetical protein
MGAIVGHDRASIWMTHVAEVIMAVEGIQPGEYVEIRFPKLSP